jgi:hypothetical protein
MGVSSASGVRCVILFTSVFLVACGRHGALSPQGSDGGRDVAGLPSDAAAVGDQIPAIDGSCPLSSGSFPDGGVCVCPEPNYRLCANPCFNKPMSPSFAGCAGIIQPYFCFDRQGDPYHCGGCDNVCDETATCRDGTCGPTSQHVVGPVVGCTGLHVATGAGTLFWTDTANGTVSRMPTSGGAAVTLAKDQSGPTLLALFGDTLYWIDSGAQSLMKVPAAGGTPALVATSPNAGDLSSAYPGINGFTVGADGTVYFSSETHVYAVAARGGAPIDVVDEARGGVPWGLAISGTALAYTNAINGNIDVAVLTPGQIAACGVLTNGNDEPASCQIARSDEAVMDSIFIEDGEVYWADNVDDSGQFAPISAASPSSVSSFGGVDEIAAFTVVGDTAFMITGTDVVAASLVANSITRPLARLDPALQQLNAISVAADDARVYWSTFDLPVDGGSSGMCFIDSVAR